MYSGEVSFPSAVVFQKFYIVTTAKLSLKLFQSALSMKVVDTVVFYYTYASYGNYYFEDFNFVIKLHVNIVKKPLLEVLVLSIFY